MTNTLEKPVPSETARPQRLRFVTAAALFDGHDASINIMRRILQAQGAEVIHLAHNRSVDEVVTAAIQEDAHGIAVSSYQGGHVEYFKYMRELLEERGAGHIQVVGGGGGVIVPSEIEELQQAGVIIYSPEDGQRLGLVGMIEDAMGRTAQANAARPPAPALQGLPGASDRDLARIITALEDGAVPEAERAALREEAASARVPVLGITGTGGAGKSSLTDELIRRIGLDQRGLRLAIVSIDPSRRKSGGALLGDRIRMNAVYAPGVYMRSLATREAGKEISEALPDVIAACKLAGFDLVIVETSGIGQGDAAIAAHVDLSLYVMTPEFGAASQLEKIDMLDFADLVAINKFDRRGAKDALRDVSKQLQRNREAWSQDPSEMPVFGTQASLFNDDGVTALYFGLKDALQGRGFAWPEGTLQRPEVRASTRSHEIVPASRARYLAEIAETVRGYHAETAEQARVARELQALRAAGDLGVTGVEDALREREERQSPEARRLLESWPQTEADYTGDEMVTQVRGREIRTALTTVSLSGLHIPKVALPRLSDHGDLLRFLRSENLPGRFPFTAGVFPFKREGEDPTRMFAGEGDAARTNRRFKLLSEGMPAKRLSTAFDSVTLYGADPDERPDIYGKIGTSGVSIATLDDMRVLFGGFDLSSPSTSVSMTINGPAPTILAMFLNVAMEQDVQKFQEREGREPDAAELAALNAETLRQVRGTVQADILKEDQGQNTCIFSTEFSLKVMGDIQAYFVENEVRNFYSVSISGYHIAEAGANPVTQLAFTLANGLTYVESYLARGMHIDDFAPNLSFFFSNGMDPEYSVMGRVARRIWAVTMRERYGANERSQKLKYHIQTSGRSLHAQEMDFNDIRTTLQALIAIYDNTNSLHTNAFDEAITTPSAESVRRALAIQLIINREWGVATNQNPNQGGYFFEQLTDMVEEAVLAEFERISERGGVLGAMETGYQRGKIQEESMLYEHRKHDGSLPIIGVNTFLNPEPPQARELELARGTEDEKQAALTRLREFQARNEAEAPAMLRRLQKSVLDGENVFAVLMDAVKVCSLGQITNALFEVGGQYRRNM